MQTILVFILLSITPILAFAQKTNLLWCNELSMEQGLSSEDYNYYTYCDSEGFVWVSSTKGLNRFDGQNVKQYRSNRQDSSSLFGENIQSRFFEDTQKNIWFCTYQSIHRYNRLANNFQHFFIKNKAGETIQSNYYVFHLEQERYLWFRLAKQIYRWDINTPIETAQIIANTHHFHVFVGENTDGSVRYLFASDNKNASGLDFFEIENGQLKNQKPFFHKDTLKLPALHIFQVYYEDEANVWLSTNKGILHWGLQRQEPKLYPKEFNESHASLLNYDDQYLIVAFTGNKGLYWFDKKTKQYQHYDLKWTDRPDQLIQNSIRSLSLDRHKNIWITLYFNGLAYVHPPKNKFNSFTNPSTFTEEATFLYRNFIQENQHTIWCAYNKGIFIHNTNGVLDEVRSKQISASIPATIRSIYKDQKDHIWCTTQRGLFIFNTKKQVFEAIESMKGLFVHRLVQLKNGVLLASTYGAGIFKIYQKNGHWHSKKIMAQASSFTSMYEDAAQGIYICHEEENIHLYTYTNDSLIFQRQLPIRGEITAYHEDLVQKKLWIAAASGLVEIDQTQLDKAPKIYTEKDGLPDKSIMAIQPYQQDKLWLSTNTGLALFDKNTHHTQVFSRSDGTLSIHFHPSASLQLENKDLWFGGAQGITIIAPKSIQAIETEAAILLTDIQVNDEPAPDLACVETQTKNPNQIRHIRQNYDKKTLSFYFSGSDYADPYATNLQYKLAPIDKDWVRVPNGQRGFARYPNLPYGEYIFAIRGANSDGLFNASPKELNISILPHFTETTEFLFSILALISLVIGIGVWLYLRNIRQKAQLKTRIAENKMAALIAQMNPHFIFNSMQSINRYILKNDKMLASDYLVRFSKLMRMILEGSRVSTHSLEKEIDLLQLYMKVEAKRFAIPFAYDLIVDDEVDIYETDLPSMMLQPFVENAIWHGLSNKETQGTINIHINKKDQLLQCVVEDNGIGRKKATEISLQKGKSHQSRALQIVEERLDLLFPKQKHLCSIRYIDLADEQGNGSGTRVEIYLPFMGAYESRS